MPRIARKFVIAAVLVVIGALVVAGVTSANSALRIKASKTKFAFNVTTLKAKHGKVTITMSNPSSTLHAVAISGHGVKAKGKTVGKGKTSTVTVSNLKKGTYTFYCPVDGHRAAGMKGKLVVS
jgi:plastocyanin